MGSICLIALILRFYHLGQWPPGLYRDEAFNGLDSLNVLNGQQHPLFFAANNGREPTYIYLTTLAILAFGRTPFALRFVAATVGGLTTLLVYRLSRSWYDPATALAAAWLWATTFWTVHLGRIGLRIGLLAPALTLAFLVGTWAVRRQTKTAVFLAGLAYGACFYTYLAARFTPLLLVVLGVYGLWLNGRSAIRIFVYQCFFFACGTVIAVAPLLWTLQKMGLLMGRVGQVSIFSSAVSHGHPWQTLAQNMLRAAGMFLWRGDTILRHNAAGRPVFDMWMAIPFLIGVALCLRDWRQPAKALPLLWTAVMLGPTLLAADTPHFLRAAGVLPGVLFLPAIGLAWLWQWERLPQSLRRGLVIALALASLAQTGRDYAAYAQAPDTAYLFETAATTLAEQINQEPAGRAVFLDERYWSGWPSVMFLVPHQPTLFNPETGLLAATDLPFTVYVWPYGPLDFMPTAVPPTAHILPELGPLSRGDLEPEAYPLYLRYQIQPLPQHPTLAVFGDKVSLQATAVTSLPDNRLQIDLDWTLADQHPAANLTVFVHVLANGQIIGQADSLPAAGYWPWAWWRQGWLIRDSHILSLSQPYNPATDTIEVGLYDPATLTRLSVETTDGTVTDHWLISDKPSGNEP